MVEFNRSESQFKCCFYLHVRTGTIILGVLHILLQLIVISTLLVAALKQDVTLLNPSYNSASIKICPHKKPPSDLLYMLMHVIPGFTVFHKSHSDFSTKYTQDKIKTATNLDSHVYEEKSNSARLLNLFSNSIPSTDPSVEKSEILKNPSVSLKSQPCYDRHTNPYVSLCLALFSLTFGYLLVHGVISRQPSHLLPFFCLQVFDFVIALICMLGYMSSASDIGYWLKEKIADSASTETSKFQHINLNPTHVALIMFSMSALILAFKSYCIGMVWDCHRYLLLTSRNGLLGNNSDFPNFPFFLGGLLRRTYTSPFSREQTERGRVSVANNESINVTLPTIPTELPKDSALPKYEEALMMPANAFAPPPYFGNSGKESSEKVTQQKAPQ